MSRAEMIQVFAIGIVAGAVLMAAIRPVCALIAAALDEPEKRVAKIVRTNRWAHLFARPAPPTMQGFGRIQWEHGL